MSECQNVCDELIMIMNKEVFLSWVCSFPLSHTFFTWAPMLSKYTPPHHMPFTLLLLLLPFLIHMFSINTIQFSLSHSLSLIQKYLLLLSMSIMDFLLFKFKLKGTNAQNNIFHSTHENLSKNNGTSEDCRRKEIVVLYYKYIAFFKMYTY